MSVGPQTGHHTRAGRDRNTPPFASRRVQDHDIRDGLIWPRPAAALLATFPLGRRLRSSRYPGHRWWLRHGAGPGLSSVAPCGAQFATNRPLRNRFCAAFLALLATQGPVLGERQTDTSQGDHAGIGAEAPRPYAKWISAARLKVARLPAVAAAGRHNHRHQLPLICHKVASNPPMRLLTGA